MHFNMSNLLIDVIILLITCFKRSMFSKLDKCCKLIICLISRICNNEYLHRSCLIIRLDYALHCRNKSEHSKIGLQEKSP